MLTNERLFFFEKSLGSETVEEFALKSVSSLEVRKSLGGEQLVIHASGNHSEIKQMFRGQADELARQFRTLIRDRETPPAVPAATSAEPATEDPMAQLERLAELHVKGVIDARRVPGQEGGIAQADLNRLCRRDRRSAAVPRNASVARVSWYAGGELAPLRIAEPRRSGASPPTTSGSRAEP